MKLGKFFLILLFVSGGILVGAAVSAQVCPHIYEGINCGANWYCGGCRTSCPTCPGGAPGPANATVLNYVNCTCNCAGGEILCGGLCTTPDTSCPTVPPRNRVDAPTCPAEDGCGACKAGYSADPLAPDAPNPCLKTAYIDYANIGTFFQISGDLKSAGGDLYLPSGRAIRIDGAGATTLNVGNYTGASLDLNLSGGLVVKGAMALVPQGAGSINAEKLCIQGSCRDTWPAAISAFVDEGNVGFGPTAVLGTNDNVPMSLETNGVGRVQISAAGNVGIGTTNTAFNLMVGGVAPRIYLLPSPGSNPELDFGSPAMDTHWAIYRDTATDQLRFWRNDNKLVLTNDGKVGFGTDNPLYKLTIAGVAPREYLWPSGGGNPELDFGNVAGDSHWAIYRDLASDQLRFWRTSDRLILANNGNVGIGISPNYKLDVAGQINASTNLTPAIQGTSSGDAGGVFQSDGVGGVGVYGITNNQSSFGLYGLASGESSTAVSGTASSLAGLNKGGSFFAGNASIVTGGDNNIGVMAAGGGSPGKNYGGYFKAQGAGYGVYSVVTDAGAWSGYFIGGQGVYTDAGVVGAAAGGYKGAGTLNAIQLCIQGNCLGAWPAGATPGGMNGQIQFNDGGTFSGDAGLTFDKVADVLTIGGNLKVGMGAAGNDDFIYFDDGTKYIKWVDVQQMFNFSNGILSDSFLSGTQLTVRSGGYNQAVDATNTKSINMQHTGVYGLLSTESANPGTDAGNLVLKSDTDYPADYVEVADELRVNSTLTLLGAGIFLNDLTVSGNIRARGGSIIVYRCVDGAPANEGALVADYDDGEPKAFCGGAGTFTDTGLRVK